MSVFEAGMLVCFGASWPTSLIATYKAKCVKGKSILFLWLIFTGYIFGMAHKFIYNMDYVIWLYLLNAVFVAFDIGFWYKYRDNEPLIAHNNRLTETECELEKTK